MDVENLRHFVQDYAVRALIPYVEQLVATLNEAVSAKLKRNICKFIQMQNR